MLKMFKEIENHCEEVYILSYMMTQQSKDQKNLNLLLIS
jgi:hypothetical protein